MKDSPRRREKWREWENVANLLKLNDRMASFRKRNEKEIERDRHAHTHTHTTAFEKNEQLIF